MREGWRRTRLGDVLTQVHRPVVVAELDKVPFAGVRWYSGGVYHRDTVDPASVKTRTLNRLRSGDVTYNRMWATKSSFGVVRRDADQCLVTNDFPIFEVDPVRTSSDYIGLLFHWTPFREQAASAATGTTERRRLNEKRFVEIAVPLPPLDVQRRIVDLIGALDDTIAAGETAHKSLARLRSTYVSALASTGTLRRIGDLAEVAQGKSLPKEVQGEKSGDMPFFKIADMAQPHNVFGYVKADTMMSRQRVREVGGRVVEVGSVVFPRVGAAVRTEKKRLMDVAGALDENHLVLTPKEGVSAELLLGVMEGLSLTALSQSGAVPSLNMGLIRAAEVPWPPMDRCPSSHDVLARSRALGAKSAVHFALLRDLRSNLLTALLSGEHEIPESYDELMEELAA